MQYSTFKKGELFESFVENELFKPSEYDLIHRTNSQSQNETRYAEDTLKPDFKFRCRKTQQEFYVEAKFRSKFNINDKIEVITYGQIERFKELQNRENIPIYIAVGYGGTPNNPNYVSLIPLNNLDYLELYASFLRRFNIEKELVNSSLLNLPNKQQKTKTEEKTIKEPIIEEIKITEHTKNNLKPAFKNKKIVITAIIALFITFIGVYNTFNTSIEDTLKVRTAEYYKSLKLRDIDALENYISPNVDKWYSQLNLTFTEIKEQTIAYQKRHPKSSTDIQWSTFKVTPLQNDYAVTYTMFYKLLKENKGKDKIYHLKIHAIWGEDLKLKSIYEENI